MMPWLRSERKRAESRASRNFMEKRGEKVGFESVYTTFDQGRLALIKSLFESENISYYVVNENAASIGVGGVTGSMTFMVAEDQIDLAKDLLKEISE